jgi:cytochrome c-type biogenesis protein CcmH
MLWVLIAVMTAAAVMAVLWPLSRRARDLRSGNDVAVYKDQLEEIGRDQNWGLIAPSEAEAARVEVSRRLIAAADADAKVEQPSGDASLRSRRLVAALALAILPICAISVYLTVGSPDLPGQPLASRAAAAHGGEQSVAELFARVEKHLEQNPGDGRGWEVVAPIYMRLGRLDDAVKARRNALRLLGVTAEREADLGEALVSLANGVVTAEAKALFDHALRLDATDVMARFYSGLAAEQDGRGEDAARIWRALAADAPEGAPWLVSVQRALARVDSSAAAAVRAPDAPDVAAAPPAPQGDVIRGMVERLAARLRRDGSDVDGWIQLVRSYTVLKDSELALAAGDDARKALAGDPDKLARLEAGIKAIAAGAPPPESEVATPAVPGAKDAAPVAAPAAQQGDMIRGMVDRLAARLRRDGSDVDDWIKLVRSYTVLKESEQAREAGNDARKAFAGDPDKLARLEAGIKAIAAGAPPPESEVATPTAPSANDGAAAPPAQEGDMIRGMVERLAARLHRDGADVDGWIQLVRSYMVLGEADKARAAVTDAQRALEGDADKLRRLDEGAKSLGVGG